MVSIVDDWFGRGVLSFLMKFLSRLFLAGRRLWFDWVLPVVVLA